MKIQQSQSKETKSTSIYDDEYFMGTGYCDKHVVEQWKEDKGKTLPLNLRELFELGNVKPGDRALDLGCGFGHFALHCALGGCKTYAQDSSEAAIRLSRRTFDSNNVSVKLVKRDCWNLPFADSSFDVVYMIALAWHLRKDELTRTLQEVRRILKQDGRLVINTCSNPWTETYGFPFLWIYKKIYNRPFFTDTEKSGHVNRTNPLKFKRTLEKEGLSVNLQVGFDPNERKRFLHKLILATPAKYILCKTVRAVCRRV